MATDKKYIPKDSAKKQPRDNQAVKQEADKDYTAEEAGFKDPAKKRKYSEQPPTKRNAKT